MAQHSAVVEWHNSQAGFIQGEYSRAHQWRFDGGASIQASASPHIVPLPYSVAENVDPEEAFIASISSCHMLFFLSICAKKKLEVSHYRDAAVGELAPNDDGKMAMTVVKLRPQVTFAGDKVPSKAQIATIHQLAHASCFIANSIKTEVVVEC
ncbi:OsmC family protein [Aliikangiella sp. IMCC44653]